MRRGEESGRHCWSPFNIVLWLSLELVFTAGQIIVVIAVLPVSRHKNPQSPLFAWIDGYAVGCAAILPTLYWHYLNYYQDIVQDSAQLHQDPSEGNSTSEPHSHTTISLARTTEEEDD
ncbi:hypothetical protein U1Q18_015394 [Sarracenia purpurea var. burkii]